MNYKKIILIITGLLLIISGIFLHMDSSPGYMKDDIIQIQKGDSVSKVARTLKKKNLIRYENFFKYLAILQRANVIIGKYKIYEGMTSNEILRRLSKGEILRKKITIPEGFNIYEIAEILSENDITQSDDFLTYSSDKKLIQSLGLNSISIEGYLFPDTYIFAEGKDARDIITVMYNRLKEVLATLDLKNMKKLNLNTDKLLNLSSLIEKEAKVPEERTYISAVFHNRLKRDIALYCDPTVRYAVKKFKGRIRYSDLKSDSPYNTYRYKGLPPTPICSPGRESIIAALNPAKSNFLYFVARNDGSHYFSKTLKEHNRAVEYYQKGIKNGFIDNQKL